MKTRREREKVLYQQVRGWMKKRFRCFRAEVTKGIRKWGIPDIIGIRDIGGELSGDIETIIIEVKRGDDAFARACGQTLGYNVYANRVYLADKRPTTFSPEEMQVASHLGIGLIQIRDHTCIEVLSGPFYTPIRRLNLDLLEILGVGRCQFCDSFFEMGNAEQRWLLMMRGEEPFKVIAKAFDSDKGIIFWNTQASVVTSKPANGGRGKSGQRLPSGTRLLDPPCLPVTAAEVRRRDRRSLG